MVGGVGGMLEDEFGLCGGMGPTGFILAGIGPDGIRGPGPIPGLGTPGMGPMEVIMP